MTEPKFDIRTFDQSKKRKRVRRVDPAPPIPKDKDGWDRLYWMRDSVKELRQWLDDNTARVHNINDPVISRTLLTIHRAMIRMEKRTFLPYVSRVLTQNEPKDTP